VVEFQFKKAAITYLGKSSLREFYLEYTGGFKLQPEVHQTNYDEN
jgi:hypothetical protein